MRIIAGSKRGATIKTLDTMDTRPTLDRVRENIFNILQNDIYEARVLDLFAGSGALGLEAISRGASFVFFNDVSRTATDIIQENVTKLGFLSESKITCMDWRVALKKLLQERQKFDIVLLDAPYDNDYIHECVSLCQKVLMPGGKIMVEHDASVVDLPGCSKTRKYGKALVSMIE